MSILSHHLAGIHVKARSRTTGATILLSAGSKKDKTSLLPSVRRLVASNVRIFATDGTHRFLQANSIPSKRVFKLSDGKRPNIRELMRAGAIDLIVNILTGDPDYDEASDYRIIRAGAIESDVPIFTDARLASMAMERLANSLGSPGAVSFPAWDMKAAFMDFVKRNGGMACNHAHLDKSYVISLENLQLGQVDMQKKWMLFRYIKENYTHEDLVARISRGCERMVEQGVRYCRTMVDADTIVKGMAMDAALEVKHQYEDRLKLDIGVQPLEGVVDSKARKYYEAACEKADFIGGLPSRDRPMPEKHLDIIMGIAKRLGKPVDVHVDQENNPHENETELLALKAVEHGLEGKVNAIHSVSLSARAVGEQRRVARLLREAGVSVVVCPSAAVSMKQLAMEGPLHNSIAPVPLLLEEKVNVCLGVDNIHDLFMPLVDGDIWFECRLLMEATRFYDLEAVAKLVCRTVGKK